MLPSICSLVITRHVKLLVVLMTKPRRKPSLESSLSSYIFSPRLHVICLLGRRKKLVYLIILRLSSRICSQLLEDRKTRCQKRCFYWRPNCSLFTTVAAIRQNAETLIKLHSISKKKGRRRSRNSFLFGKALLPLRNKNGRNSIAEVKEAKRKKGFWARSKREQGGWEVFFAVEKALQACLLAFLPKVLLKAHRSEEAKAPLLLFLFRVEERKAKASLTCPTPFFGIFVNLCVSHLLLRFSSIVPPCNGVSFMMQHIASS